MKRTSSKLRSEPESVEGCWLRVEREEPAFAGLRRGRHRKSTTFSLNALHIRSGHLFCRNYKTEEKAGKEAAEVSGHADLRSEEVEGQLHEDDDEDVA